MPRLSAFSLTLVAAMVLTGGLVWQALRDYQSAAPVATWSMATEPAAAGALETAASGVGGVAEDMAAAEADDNIHPSKG